MEDVGTSREQSLKAEDLLGCDVHEWSSEINIDYLSDECDQITIMLQDKYHSLLEENGIKSAKFKSMSLSEQFECIERLQRSVRDRKHEKFVETSEKKDLMSFSKT